MIKIKSLAKQEYYRKYYQENKERIQKKALLKPKPDKHIVIFSHEPVTLYFD